LILKIEKERAAAAAQSKEQTATGRVKCYRALFNERGERSSTHTRVSLQSFYSWGNLLLNGECHKDKTYFFLSSPITRKTTNFIFFPFSHLLADGEMLCVCA
jgi:hypothetical protein